MARNYFAFLLVASIVGYVTITCKFMNRVNKHEKVILLWNAFYTHKDYGLGYFGREAFTKNKCKVDNCRLETRRSLLGDATAVVFHVNGKDMDKLPKRINGRQLFVYFLREPPPLTSRFSRKHSQMFNITMTYRHDSDIPVPISRMIPKEDNSRLDVQPYKLKHPLSSRERTVAWMVSHCDVSSKRHLYVESLSKYIDVDIIGACGKIKCEKEKQSKCMEELENNYKFYLAFENSICEDYVTEKLYRTLSYELVPIVYGAVNYAEVSPPHSYINVLDFDSPKHLADYLKYLSSNVTAYEAYFKWKPYWKMIGNNDLLRRGFCRLCELINERDFRKTYKDVHSWWVRGRCNQTVVDKIVESSKRDL